MKLDIENDRVWNAIRAMAGEGFRSSFHFAIASIDPDGAPRVSPIGSLRLMPDRTAVYFEIFTQGLSRNLDTNPQLCILAVNSSRWYWLRSLYAGRFAALPAVRLFGVAGPTREVTMDDVEWWERRVGKARRLRGYRHLWGRDLLLSARARPITITRVEAVQLGEMTREMLGEFFL